MDWLRLCPAPVAADPVIEAVAGVLADSRTAADLGHAEASCEYPETVLTRLCACGLMSLFSESPGDDPRAPPRLTAYHLGALNALAARASGSLAITLGVNALALLPAYIAADEDQLARIFSRVRAGAFSSILLSELDHGSDLLANEARAERLETGEYRLEGEKHLINGGQRHPLLFALMRTGAGASTGGLQATGELSLFFVERDPSVQALPRLSTLPARAADISGVRFCGTRVEARNRLGRQGEGFALVQKTLSISRGGVSGLAAGAATRAAELACVHAEERRLYGAPIGELGAIAAHLRRARALALAASALSVKQAAAVNALGLGAAHHTACAKLGSALFAEEAVTEARRVLGARALLAAHPLERQVRDVLLYGLFDGTTHVMLDQIQWRLAQAAARPSTPDEDLLLDTRAMFARPPRRLIEAVRQRSRVKPPAPAAMARMLAGLDGAVELAPLVALAEALLSLVRQARTAGRWDADQSLRFDAAENFVTVEALLALVELADPDRRGALGMATVDVDVASYRFALGWLGARAAARLRGLALLHGLSASSDLDPAEAQLAALAAKAF